MNTKKNVDEFLEESKNLPVIGLDKDGLEKSDWTAMSTYSQESIIQSVKSFSTLIGILGYTGKIDVEKEAVEMWAAFPETMKDHALDINNLLRYLVEVNWNYHNKIYLDKSGKSNEFAEYSELDECLVDFLYNMIENYLYDIIGQMENRK